MALAFGLRFPRRLFNGDEETFLRAASRASVVDSEEVDEHTLLVSVPAEGFVVEVDGETKWATQVVVVMESTLALAARGENVLAPFVGNFEVTDFAAC
jgi:hypothetical protein